MNKKRRYIWNNKNGISSVIETVIATAIIFTVLALFYTSINSLYHVHVRDDIDLQVKCNDVSEMFIGSPGRDQTFNLNWEEDVGGDTASLGLSVTPTIAYGTFYYEDPIYKFNLPIYDLYQNDAIGSAISACFLAGTQIITADGSYKNIEDVEVGDMVKSINMETGNIVDRRVITVYHHIAEEMTEYYLVINNFLKVTPNHLLYRDGQWVCFDQVNVGDVINSIPVYSVEKVFEQVPTFDLEIENDHNYFVCIYDDSFLVHNEDIPDFIDWNPWVATRKNVRPDEIMLESYGVDYYVEYTYFNPGNHEEGGLYEIKSEADYLYPVLDSQKIDQLKEPIISYEAAKGILGLVDDYELYGIHVTISSEYYSGNELVEYGAAYGQGDVIVSTTRNVVIYHPPKFSAGFDPDDSDTVIPPYYETGQLTVRMFFGGSVGP